MKEFFLIGSVLVALLTQVVGIRAIFKGHYKPQRTTRFIYLMNSSLFVATLFASGERTGIFMALVQFLACSAIFVLSLKYGMGGKSLWDLLVLVSAVFTLIIWYSTSNPVLALYLSILTDIIGASPTIIKSFKKPFTETPKFYLCDVVASILAFLSLKTYGFRDIGFPLYILGINVLIFLILVLRQKALKPNLQQA